MLARRLLTDSTRRPDETWLLCEGADDVKCLRAALRGQDRSGVTVKRLPTPTLNGRYAVIPYSNKINWALDRTDADLIVYLDNGSTPHARKYELMCRSLEQWPDWGAVYCGQKRTGYMDVTYEARQIVDHADGQLNYTQVMHRVTEDRWPLDMALADPDVADGKFWGMLHRSLGAFYPAGVGYVLDEHHMPSPKAQGL